MKMKDYLSSSERHKNFCKEILSKTLFSKDNLHNSSPLVNLYYLSGYIIECILKYAILRCLRYNKEKEVKEFSERGYNYNDHLRTHKLWDLYTTLNEITTWKILDIEKNRNLIVEWTPDVRYTIESKKLDYQKIQDFFNNANRIFEEIECKLLGVK